MADACIWYRSPAETRFTTRKTEELRQPTCSFVECVQTDELSNIYNSLDNYICF